MALPAWQQSLTRAHAETCTACTGGDDQLQLLAWAELLSLAAGAAMDAAGAETSGKEAASARTPPAQRGSAGWSGWDAGATAGATKASAADAGTAAARQPEISDIGSVRTGAAERQAFAAFMGLLLNFFDWRSRVPDAPLASPPDSQVRR